MNENPMPLSFSPSFTAERWNAIVALIDQLAPAPTAEADEEDAEGLPLRLAPVRTLPATS